jgi:outer membrane protein assembly factor BamA
MHLYSDCNIDLRLSGTPYFTEKIITDAVITEECESIEETIDNILDFYIGRSFPFVTVRLDSVRYDEEKDILFLNINSGDYVVIGEIGFKGAEVTKKKVLIRQSRMKTGERFDERTADLGLLWLYKSGLFRKRPEREFFRYDNIYGINYIISEKKYNEIMLLGGYSSDDKEDNISVTAEIRMDNIFGTMRKASILWDRSSDIYENLKLGYFEPFLFTADISTELKYSQKYKKYLSLTRSYSVMQSYSFDPSSSMNYGFSGQTVYPDSLYTGSGKRIISNKYSAGLKYSTIYHRQTIPQDPGFGTEIMLSSVEIDIEDSLSVRGAEIFAGTDYLINPYKQIFTNISGHYNQIVFKDEIPDFNRIYFGGAGSLRGYREDFFQSDIFIKGSLDVFFVTGKKDLAFRIFYDACYYNPSRQNVEKFKDLSFLSGMGGGIIFEGNSGYIELTAGIPLDQDVSESVLHVKYSVRF